MSVLCRNDGKGEPKERVDVHALVQLTSIALSTLSRIEEIDTPKHQVIPTKKEIASMGQEMLWLSARMTPLKITLQSASKPRSKKMNMKVKLPRNLVTLDELIVILEFDPQTLDLEVLKEYREFRKVEFFFLHV